MVDQHTTSPIVILLVWVSILFGLGFLAGAALGWLARGMKGKA